MRIRMAEEKDFDRIIELLIDIADIHMKGRPDIFVGDGGSKYSKDQLAEMIANPDKPVFVAVDDSDCVAGYAMCIVKRWRNHSVIRDYDCLYIDDLCVDSNLRGQNIGGLLFEYITEYGRSNGFYNIELNVWEFNEGARKFYEKHGMKTQRRNMEIVL